MEAQERFTELLDFFKNPDSEKAGQVLGKYCPSTDTKFVLLLELAPYAVAVMESGIFREGKVNGSVELEKGVFQGARRNYEVEDLPGFVLKLAEIMGPMNQDPQANKVYLGKSLDNSFACLSEALDKYANLRKQYTGIIPDDLSGVKATLQKKHTSALRKITSFHKRPDAIDLAIDAFKKYVPSNPHNTVTEARVAELFGATQDAVHMRIYRPASKK